MFRTVPPELKYKDLSFPFERNAGQNVERKREINDKRRD